MGLTPAPYLKLLLFDSAFATRSLYFASDTWVGGRSHSLCLGIITTYLLGASSCCSV